MDGEDSLKRKTFDALSLGNQLVKLSGRLNAEQFLQRMKVLEKEFGMAKKREGGDEEF